MASHRIYRRVNPRLFPGDKIKGRNFAIQKAARERSEGVGPYSMCSMEEKGKEKAAANAEARAEGGRLGRRRRVPRPRPRRQAEGSGRHPRPSAKPAGAGQYGGSAPAGAALRDRQRRQATALQGFRCRPHSAAAPLRFASPGRLLRRVGPPALPRAGLPSLAVSQCRRYPAGAQPPYCPLSAPAVAAAFRCPLPACLPRAAAAPAFRPPNKYANIRICKFASMIVKSTFIDVDVYIYVCKVTFAKGQHGSAPPVLTPRPEDGSISTAVK